MTAAVFLLASGGNDSVIESSTAVEQPETPKVECVRSEIKEPKEAERPWSDAELIAMVLTLTGECYDDKVQDKRLVCEVILNRVSADGFGDTVFDVLTAPHQFDGYWTQSRSASENDYEVATKALEDWYKNDCEALSEYLFFEAGDNRENEFRKEF
ncbi:MAG: cell wall hydrolase [Bacteroides sp.]